MRRIIAATMSSVLLSAAAPPAPPMLQPVGKWQVEYADDMCVLSHAFGTAPDDVVFGLEPVPLSETDELVLMKDGGSGPAFRTGRGTIEVGSSDPAKPVAYSRYRLKDPDRIVITIFAEHDDLTGLARADRISFDVGDQRPVVIAPDNVGTALSALKTCQDDLLRGWKIDPAAQDRVATRAKANLGAVFGSDQYPQDAVRAHQQGVVMAAFHVSEKGVVDGCRIVRSSHVASLDTTTCEVISRTTYTPAKDSAGKPIASDQVKKVRWRLP